MARILIIDDDELIRKSLSRCMSDMGHEVAAAGGLGEGRLAAKAGVDVIYLDLDLPDGDGRGALDELAAMPGRPEIIVITGLGDNHGARQILAQGAWDYIKKPASPQSVRESLAGALAYRRERRQAACAPESGAAGFDACGIIGGSAIMARVLGLLRRAARSQAGVLILGETGVGKELFARAIHANSQRRGGPFVVVDCSNLTETLVESVLYGHVKGAFTGAHADRAGLVAEADGGTLFLDEVGELPMPLQRSFLRVLQERRYRSLGASRERSSDFRLVAATNRDLDAMVRAGEFRSDLLFRLRTVEVALPPLRERGEDLGELAAYFVAQACDRAGLAAKSLSPGLIEVLAGYQWPGNVRELGHVLESAVIESGRDRVLYPKHLPGNVRVGALGGGGPAAPLAGERPDRRLPAYEAYKAERDRAYFTELMAACDHDVTQASRISGLSVPSIYRYLGLAGIPTRRARRSAPGS
jgi:two-component system NtrC family response regulator